MLEGSKGERYLQQRMDFVHREQEGVPSFPFLDGRLSISDRPLVYGVRKRLLNPLLPTQRALSQPQPPERLNKTQHSKLLPLQDRQLSTSSVFATRFPNCSLLTQLGFCLFSNSQQPSLPWAPRIPPNLLKSLIFSRAARFQSPPPVERSWIWMVFKISSNPDYSGIL